ncbi:MAG: EAL domain-containing protein [Methylococcaceae bacterium]
MKSNLNIDKNKQTFIAMIIYISWVIAFAFYSFNLEKEKLYQELDQRLIEAAQITTLLLGYDLHHKDISETSLTQEENTKNRHKLSAYTDTNNIVYIYTLVLQDNKIFFTSSSATFEERNTGEGLTDYFDQYDDVDPRVYTVFNNRKKTFIEYSDQWGTFRSVFIPIYTKDGSLYISAADVAIDYISARLRDHLNKILFIALLFILFACPLYFTATNKIKRLAKRLGNKVRLQTTELAINEERLQLALKVSKQGWFDLNLETGQVTVSDEYPQILGYSPDSFNSSKQEWQDNIHPEDKDAVMRVFQETLESTESLEMAYRRRSKDGSWVWIHSIAQVVEWSKDGEPYRMVGIHADITERKRSEQVLRTLAESGSAIDDGVFQIMLQGVATAYNVRYAFIGNIDKYNSERITTLAVWADDQIADNFSYSLVDTPCHQVTELGLCFYPDNVQKLFPKDQLLVDMGAISYLGVPLRNVDGKSLGVLALLDDKPMNDDVHILDLLGSLAVRVAIELERRESDKQLKLSSQVFKSAHEGIMITDTEGIIVEVNPTFCDITGYSYDEILGKKSSVLSSDKHSSDFFAEMREVIDDKGFWQGEIWNRKNNGELFAVLLTVSAIVDDLGYAQNYISLFSDITDTKEQQRSLELMAHYDVLTGLPNRSLFVDRYKQAVAHSQRFKTILAVCFLDLDGFKPVNDQYGHMVGDQLLIKVADRIKLELRAEDTVSRMGGDEFALLLGDIKSEAQCKQMLIRLHCAIAKIFVVEGHEIIISASSGVTFYSQDDADLDTLLRHADQAMYQAKLAGRNQFQVFDLDQDQQLVDKQQCMNDVHAAILNNEMHLFYQPKVNMKTGKVIGVEGLIRWLHPEKGIIPPLAFLPMIDDTELEVLLGEWVIKTALQQLDQWQSEGLQFEVSVNISSYHIQTATFVAKLTAILENYAEVDSKYLQLEILESSALGDVSIISHIISTCRKNLGVHIALDDFGTGYSSLIHLRNLDANILKIDQSFVKNVLDDANDHAIIEGIIGLAIA